ncbi:MAG: V-type ATPase 116kDa subunit family protein [Bacilli bacterium]
MIVPVKKVRLLAPQSEREALIKLIQHENKFMLFDHQEEVSLPSDLSQHLKRIERGVEELSKYEKKKFFSFHEASRSEFEKVEHEAERLLNEIDENLTLIEKKKADNVGLVKDIASLKPYLNISVATKALNRLVKTRIVIGYIARINFDEFLKEANDKGHIFEESSRDEEFVYGAFGYELVYENQAILLLNSYRFKEQTLPLFDTKLSELLPELNASLADNEAIIKEKEGALKALSNKVNVLRTYYDYSYNKAVRSQVKTGQTERVVYIEGWMREDQIDTFKASLSQKLDYDFEELSVNDEELVPTATKNNVFVQQFESITNMFSVPSHKEIDPNPVMSIWYWIIFGIMMGDIGYGLAMLVFFTLFIKYKRPKGQLRNLAMIFAFSSVPSIIFGIFTGSLFGFTFDLGKVFGSWFGNPNFSLILLQPVDDPLPMLIFSLGLGILHIITALVMKILNEARKKDILAILADGVSWILILLGAVFAAIGLMSPTLKIMSTIGLVLAGLGALLILFLNGRSKKGIISKGLSGLGGLYGVTSYLSDVLSYSRLLALSLSTAVIAFTMNLLAGMVAGVPIVGILLAIVVYLIGHVFNFVMGLLSAYVHDGRLQYLEFFGKFYEGGGYEFAPFAYKFKYLDAIKENE